MKKSASYWFGIGWHGQPIIERVWALQHYNPNEIIPTDFCRGIGKPKIHTMAHDPMLRKVICWYVDASLSYISTNLAILYGKFWAIWMQSEVDSDVIKLETRAAVCI